MLGFRLGFFLLKWESMHLAVIDLPGVFHSSRGALTECGSWNLCLSVYYASRFARVMPTPKAMRCTGIDMPHPADCIP